jgi:uncharacterized FAD-dependent dehydrogenase
MKKIQITNFIASWGFKDLQVIKQLSKKYGISENQIQLKKKALDMRGKRPRGIYTFLVDYNDQTAALTTINGIKEIEYTSFEEKLKTLKPKKIKPVIVGLGPAGLFAALTFIAKGIKPIVIERGKPVNERIDDVVSLWKEGKLNPNSNPLFGEGGAGTFSDGKLTTRINHPFVDFVLHSFAKFGARDRIKTDSKPHIGTDKLVKVMENARKYLIEKGAEIHFSTTLTDFKQVGDKLEVICNNGKEFACDYLLLAIGHSARDTYKMLYDKQVEMEPKPFAVGMRIEHPQEIIDNLMYGKNNRGKFGLPPASYQYAWNGKNGEGCYSFCMCPGGEVILTVNEEKTLCVNGMSDSKRNSYFANSAIVAKVPVTAYHKDNILDGIAFQKDLEEKGYSMGIPGYMAPSQKVTDFLKGNLSRKVLPSSYSQALYSYPMHEFFPKFIVSSIRNGLDLFNKRTRGFVCDNANFIGIESRTSAPVRILRNKESFLSLSNSKIVPIGEGAGYAGGIMSSALDGINSVFALLKE